MKIADLNTNLIEGYFMLLKNLSPNIKLELIARLSDSMKTPRKKNREISLDSLYGSWESDGTADELIAEIKTARNFNRNREKL